MNSLALFFLIILISATLALGSAAATEEMNITEFIKTSCNVTLYTKLCVSSLSSYAGSLKPTQNELVKAAVNVSLLHAHNVSSWATALKTRIAKISKRERAALEDCIEVFEDSRDEIHGSLAELKHLRRNTFDSQMDDVQTLMSGALTDQDSCLDGFQNVKGKVKAMVTIRVQNVYKLISNALALVNAFAATGGGNSIPV